MSYFKMSAHDYAEYVKKKSPNSNLVADTLKAFLAGGLICCVGQGFYELYSCFMFESFVAPLVSVTLVFLGAILTGFGVYDDLAKFGGAGTLVPITGFANAMVAPAIESKTEGFVTGTAAQMFAIAGPVIVYGVSASVIYGVILMLCRLF